MQLHPSWLGASGEEVSSRCSPPPQLLQEVALEHLGAPSAPPPRKCNFHLEVQSGFAGVSDMVESKGLQEHLRVVRLLQPETPSLLLPVHLLSIKPLQRMSCHLEKKNKQGVGETTPL